jgi:uncharacterized protein with LGFP repeats
VTAIAVGTVPEGSGPSPRRWWVYCLPVLCLPVLVGIALVVMARFSAQPARAAAVYTGQAFDTCSAPSASTMQGWLSSPYRGIGIYIGGANRACGDGNLSAGWANTVQAQGWKLAPLYVGLQAPCVNQGGLATINPGSASAQGAAAADDAAQRAANFGMGAGTPIYFDMEAYGGGCSDSVRAFEYAWTAELHRLGLVSGVYGSQSSAINDLAGPNPNNPDDIWYAAWNGNASVETGSVLPSAYQDHQRIHQYHGDTTQSFGGVALDIDLDFADGALTGTGIPSNCTSFSSPATGTHQVCGAIRDKYLALGGPGGFLGFPTTDEGTTPNGIGRFNYFSNHGAIYWTGPTGAWSIHGAVLDKWASLGWENSFLGFPTTDEGMTPNGIGRYNFFSLHGAVYWTGPTGSWSIHGALLDKWASLGYENSYLGFPTTDEGMTPNGIGRYNFFSLHGAVYWTGPTGSWSIHGSILDKWASLGYENSYLGFPMTDEGTTPNKIGRYNYFSLRGAVYWTGPSGAWTIRGAILDKWAKLGYETSALGFPVTDEGTTPNKIGRYNYFSNHGAIYWTGPTGAWSIHGAILDKWATLGWETGFLGFPTTDEGTTPNKIGRYNYFSNHGAIYWTAPTGASSIHGAILAKWASLGWETSVVGFPVTDETGTPDRIGRFNHFSLDGSIYWTPGTSAWSVHGAIRAKWAGMGWERSCLGYPINDELGIAGGRRSNFQHGDVIYDFSRGLATASCT